MAGEYLDEEGNVYLDEQGNPLKEPPAGPPPTTSPAANALPATNADTDTGAVAGVRRGVRSLVSGAADLAGTAAEFAVHSNPANVVFDAMHGQTPEAVEMLKRGVGGDAAARAEMFARSTQEPGVGGAVRAGMSGVPLLGPFVSQQADIVSDRGAKGDLSGGVAEALTNVVGGEVMGRAGSRMVAKLPGQVARTSARAAESFGERASRMTAEQLAEAKKLGQNPGRALAQTPGVAKDPLGAIRKAREAQAGIIDETLDTAADKPVLDLRAIRQVIADAKAETARKAGATGEGQIKGLHAIDESLANEYGESGGKLVRKGPKKQEGLTPRELNEEKRLMYGRTYDNDPMTRASLRETTKKAGNVAKRQIEQVVPEVRDANTRYGELADLEESIQDATLSDANKAALTPMERFGTAATVVKGLAGGPAVLATEMALRKLPKSIRVNAALARAFQQLAGPDAPMTVSPEIAARAAEARGTVAAQADARAIPDRTAMTRALRLANQRTRFKELHPLATKEAADLDLATAPEELPIDVPADDVPVLADETRNPVQVPYGGRGRRNGPVVRDMVNAEERIGAGAYREPPAPFDEPAKKIRTAEQAQKAIDAARKAAATRKAKRTPPTAADDPTAGAVSPNVPPMPPPTPVPATRAARPLVDSPLVQTGIDPGRRTIPDAPVSPSQLPAAKSFRQLIDEAKAKTAQAKKVEAAVTKASGTKRGRGVKPADPGATVYTPKDVPTPTASPALEAAASRLGITVEELMAALERGK